MSPRPAKNRAGRQTVERLLDAAERLVATNGPQVPLRQITQAAGQQNNSAIAYHFGSRQGLLDAVWERRTQRVNGERTALLAAMAADGSIDDLRALLEVHVLPMTNEIGAHLPSYWARFNEVTLAQMPLAFLESFDDDLAQRVGQEVPLRTLADVFHRMCTLISDGSEVDASLRVALMVRFVVAGLAGWERDQEVGLVAGDSLAPFAHGLVELAYGMLVNPSPAMRDAAPALHASRSARERLRPPRSPRSRPPRP